MNKKIVIIFIVGIVVSFIVGFFIGDSTAISRVNRKIAQRVGTADKVVPRNKQEPKGKEEPKKLETIMKGQASKVGDFDLSIIDVKEGEEFNFTSDKSTASGKFIVIKLQLKNVSSGPAEYDKNMFALLNGTTVYTIDDNGFSTMGNMNSEETIFKHNNEYVGVYDKFNPGIIKYTYIVFDVPGDTDIKDLKLVCADKQYDLK